MNKMKQTTLSFTPAQKKVEASLKTTPDGTSTPSSSKATKSLRRKKASSKRKMSVYVEIPPPTRGPRATPSARESSVKSTSTRMSTYGLPRITSMKRKLSPEPEVDELRDGIPLITVDPASSQPKLAYMVSDGQKKPSKKPRLSSSSPLSALTPLPPSSAPSSVHGTDMDDVEFVPTSQSDELELTLPRDEDKEPSDVQETVDRWRKETLPEPPSRADSPFASDRFGSPLSDIPMDVDYDMFPQPEPLTIPDTPVADSRTSGSVIPYPQTPLSAHGEGPEVPSSVTVATSEVAVSCVETPSQRDTERKAHAPDVSPSDAFRSLTPPPSSSDKEEEALQEVPVVEVLDVKSKTAQLIADIRARALAAARSSPEQPRKELEDLSDSDSESSSDDDDGPGLVAQLMRDTKGKVKAADAAEEAGSSRSTPTATSRYNLRRTSPKTKLATPATQVRKPRKADPLGALLREKQRDERNGTGMVAVRGAEATLAQSKAGLRDEMEDEEDGTSSDSDAEFNRRSVTGKGKGRTSSPAGPSRTQKAKRKDEDGSDDDEDITGLDCEAILGKEGGEAVGKILASDIKEKMAQALAKLKEEPLGVPFWARADACGEDRDDGMDAEETLPPFTAEVGGNATRQMLKNVAQRNDTSQLSALLSSGFVSFLKAEQYPVVIPWLFAIAFSNVSPSLRTLTYTQLLRLGPLVGSQTSGLRTFHVLAALTYLGASASVLERHEWTKHVDAVSSSRQAGDEEWRDEMTYRLASLVAAFVQSFARDELIDILFALILVGMDPSTSAELQTTIRKTCDIVVKAMTPWQEFSACTKIVGFGKTLTPPNQVLLISFIPSISPATVRMARCIARALLLDDVPSALEYENGLPDLTPFVDLLDPAPGTGGPFDILGNTDKEGFYDALTCRVALLGRVLSDIDEYTLRAMDEVRRKAEARKNGHLEEDDEPDNNENKEPKLTVLEQIKRNLDMLHGKIVDTRAAHLDRSRAKAALQRLSFRVHYQRVATTKSGRGTARPRTIAGYFNGGSA